MFADADATESPSTSQKTRVETRYTTTGDSLFSYVHPFQSYWTIDPVNFQMYFFPGVNYQDQDHQFDFGLSLCFLELLERGLREKQSEYKYTQRGREAQKSTQGQQQIQTE